MISMPSLILFLILKIDESHIDHDKVQSIEKSIVTEVPVEPSESSKPLEFPPKVRRSARST